MVKGFKAMDLDMTCRGYKFEIGQTYEIANDKPLQTCNDSGFHFCQKLEDVFRYYPFRKCRLFEVEALGDVVTGYNKSVTKKLKIVRELTQEDLNNYEFEIFYRDLWFKDRTDEELLTYKNDKEYQVRLVVAQKLKDIGCMFNTFKNDSSSYVREAVVERMLDLDLMYETFKDDEDAMVLSAVINRMTDLDLMFNTFYNNRSWFVRYTVVTKMKDLSLMYKTFKNDGSWLVRKAVVEHMEDLSLMYETFKDDPDFDVSRTVEKLMKILD